MSFDLILPDSYRNRRSQKINPKRFRGYARHIPCGGEAFWFTRFGKAWFDLDISEVHFEDGQIKLKDQSIEEFRCPHCSRHLEGKDLKLVKIIQEDEAESLHAEIHRKVPVGEICESCGERRKSKP